MYRSRSTTASIMLLETSSTILGSNVVRAFPLPAQITLKNCEDHVKFQSFKFQSAVQNYDSTTRTALCQIIGEATV